MTVLVISYLLIGYGISIILCGLYHVHQSLLENNHLNLANVYIPPPPRHLSKNSWRFEKTMASDPLLQRSHR